MKNTTQANYTLNVKLENEKINFLLEQKKNREALFLYILALKECKNKRYYQTSITMMLELMVEKAGSVKNESMRQSLQVLVDAEMIQIYSDRLRKIPIDLTDAKAVKVNTTLYIVAQETETKENFTLISHEAIDNILDSMDEIIVVDKKKETKSKNPIVDSMSVVAKLCQMISRRKNLYQVCYPSQDKLREKLGMNKNLMVEILKQLKVNNIIHFEMFEMAGQLINAKTGEIKEIIKKHHVYSMIEKSSDIQPVIEKAIKKGRLTQDCKRMKVEGVIDVGYCEIEDAEYEEFNNENIRSAFQDPICGLSVDIVLTQDVADKMNSIYQQYGEEILVEATLQVRNQIAGREDVSSPTGYFYNAIEAVAEQLKEKNY